MKPGCHTAPMSLQKTKRNKKSNGAFDKEFTESVFIYKSLHNQQIEASLLVRESFLPFFTKKITDI